MSTDIHGKDWSGSRLSMFVAFVVLLGGLLLSGYLVKPWEAAVPGLGTFATFCGFVPFILYAKRFATRPFPLIPFLVLAGSLIALQIIGHVFQFSMTTESWLTAVVAVSIVLFVPSRGKAHNLSDPLDV